MTDPIADLLTRLRNAALVQKGEVLVPFSKVKFEIAKILEREGFVGAVGKTEQTDAKGRKSPVIDIVLKYKKQESVLRGLKRISKPGNRVYCGYQDIPKVLPSLGILIISTSKGLMTNTEARQQKVGGELICEIN